MVGYCTNNYKCLRILDLISNESFKKKSPFYFFHNGECDGMHKNLNDVWQ